MRYLCYPETPIVIVVEKRFGPDNFTTAEDYMKENQPPLYIF
jgi:hypothetical protein